MYANDPRWYFNVRSVTQPSCNEYHNNSQKVYRLTLQSVCESKDRNGAASSDSAVSASTNLYICRVGQRCKEVMQHVKQNILITLSSTQITAETDCA